MMKSWPKSNAACQPTAHQSEPVTRTLTQSTTSRAKIIPMSIAFSCGFGKCAPAKSAVVINAAGQKPAPRHSDCKAYPRKTYSSVTPTNNIAMSHESGNVMRSLPFNAMP
jgi:hypothetical protein